MSEIKEIREKIDAIDQELLRLLNERAGLALEIGKIKNRDGLPIYAPDREMVLLRSLVQRSSGPLLPASIRAIYREIMSASLALEKDVLIACHGSRGGNAHQAARSKFGSSVSYAFFPEVPDLFAAVARGEADCGVVTVDDGEHGPMNPTLDALTDTDLQICAEIWGASGGAGDAPEQTSRFLVLARTGTAITGNDRTTLLLRVENKPGGLFGALEPFKDAGLNLTHFASRPAAKGSEDVYFFVEADGHSRDESFAEVLRDLSRRCRAVKILGSYPRGAKDD